MPLWIGGMLETGIGRAVNAALSALPGATMPPDLGGSDRYWHDDITEPLVATGGRMKVPTGPGIGVDLRLEVLHEATTSSTTVRPE
jgi:O-succinylbenzoate synthase